VRVVAGTGPADSRPCHACISHRHHSCMHVPRGWIWTILVHTLVCQWPFVRDRVEHWRSRAAVAVGSRRQISRWCRSAGAGGGTAAIDPFLYVRVVVPLPTHVLLICPRPGRSPGGVLWWYGYDTVRYGAVCSSLACLTVRRRRARLRSGQGRACQRPNPTTPTPRGQAAARTYPKQPCLASSVPSPAGAPSFNFLSCGDDDETTASGRKQHYSHSSLAGHAACPGPGHFQQPMSSRAMDRDRPRLYQ
jgi:hypothetical protein